MIPNVVKYINIITMLHGAAMGIDHQCWHQNMVSVPLLASHLAFSLGQLFTELLLGGCAACVRPGVGTRALGDQRLRFKSGLNRIELGTRMVQELYQKPETVKTMSKPCQWMLGYDVA